MTKVYCKVEPVSPNLLLGKEYELLPNNLIEDENGKKVLIITEREGDTCSTLGSIDNWKFVVQDEKRVL